MDTYTFTIYHDERRSVVTGVKNYTVDNGIICFYDKNSEIIICFKEWSFFEREV